MQKFVTLLFKMLCGIGLWQILVIAAKAPSYFLPSPAEVFLAFKHNYNLIFYNALVTIGQIIIGLLVSIVLGILIGFALDLFSGLRRWLQPTLVTLQAVPTFVLLPLLTIWFGFGLFPKIFVISLSACFTISLCFFDALQRTSVEFLDLARVMRAKRINTEYLIRWPSGLQGLLSGIKLASIHIPLMVLATDWHGASEGLGYLIMVSHGRLATDMIFCCLLCIVFITLSMGTLIKFLQKKILFWPAV